jgi:hypothetical protein
MLKRYEATVEWITTPTGQDAVELEAALIEWHRTLVGLPPHVNGWAPKADSPQERAWESAKELWERLYWRDGHQDPEV